jgi:hypothetical protein
VKGKQAVRMDKGEIVLYQPNDTVLVEVRLEKETVWLTQAQIADLFGTMRPTITKHLNNIYKSGELEENSTCSILEHMGKEGKRAYHTKYYNLDAILSVGYRVNSINATLFRRWANKILKDYLLRGYAIHQRIGSVEKLAIETEKRVSETEKKIDFFVKTALPPIQGVFFEGQIFDAYVFAADLIKLAKISIVLVDNYVDESVLLLLSKRRVKVSAQIYTRQISAQLQLDLTKHNSQYEPVKIDKSATFHDRFLIIDNTVYHIGASLKDLGKKLFAFSKMEIKPAELLKNV